jgi:hypothetical protein
VAQTSIAIYRVVGGQIQERWAEQGGGVLEQLGIATAGAAPAVTIARRAETSNEQ